MKKSYQISYPRSGANYLRNISRELLSLGSLDDKEYVNNNSDVYIKRHKINTYESNAYLIVIVRDYKESIVRHNKFRSKLSLIPYCNLSLKSIKNFIRGNIKVILDFIYTDKRVDANKLLKQEFDKYMYPLTLYDNWPGPKLLIYYEELVSNPLSVIDQLSKFYKVDDIKANNVKKKISIINKQSLETYSRLTDTSHTKGNKVQFHKYKLTPKERCDWDYVFMNSNYYIYNKYLSRYKEKYTKP